MNRIWFPGQRPVLGPLNSLRLIPGVIIYNMVLDRIIPFYAQLKTDLRAKPSERPVPKPQLVIHAQPLIAGHDGAQPANLPNEFLIFF